MITLRPSMEDASYSNPYEYDHTRFKVVDHHGVVLCWLMWHGSLGYLMCGFNIDPITPAQALVIVAECVRMNQEIWGH
jgi:hypothetical protein